MGTDSLPRHKAANILRLASLGAGDRHHSRHTVTPAIGTSRVPRRIFACAGIGAGCVFSVEFVATAADPIEL